MSLVSFSQRSWTTKAVMLGVGALSLGAATLSSIEPASAFGRGFGGQRFIPGGGGFRGGYGGFRGGYGGWNRGYGYRGGGYGRGFAYGLGGLGVGLALGSAYGGYGYGGYGYPGYYGAGYGGYYGGYDGCLRRVWGPYGPRWANVCY